MRKKFDDDLKTLNTLLLEMSMLIETAIKKGVKLIDVRNESLAQEVYSLEEQIDSYEDIVQNLCLKLIVEQQPMAGDLRYISAALKMITDMERIGDNAKDIAEICMMLPGDYVAENFASVHPMAKATVDILNHAVDSFVNRDLKTAEVLYKEDDIVDNYFNLLRDEIIGIIKAGTLDPAIAIDFLMIAKYLERIADHAVNISNWVVFSIRG